MKITDWPAAERPREKLLACGAESLSDAELLAIFLRTGLPGVSAVDLARQLIEAFGGLRAILEADFATFTSHAGLGMAKYAQLQAVLEMARRHLAEQLQRGDVINSPQQTEQFLLARLRSCQQEVFACLYLDSQHRLIRYQPHFFGTIDSASVYPRELVKSALACNAAALILAHNHPSGVAEPSPSDRSITEQICKAMALVDVRVLDHMVVGDGEVVSFAERGWL
ncbi:MAG: DNA repair protein RadC [Pseudomonadales bacterium]|jgi:DNA repair protein RadC